MRALGFLPAFLRSATLAALFAFCFCRTEAAGASPPSKKRPPAAVKAPAKAAPANAAPAPLPKASSASSISTKWRSPRNSKRSVRKATRFIILHTTEGAARGSLEKLSANGECHYVVDTAGLVYLIIDRSRIAYHAGLSMWNGQTGLDSVSIGIEVVGYHDKAVTAAQIEALRKLLADLKRVYKIPDNRILTHSMVAFGNPNHWHKRKHRGRKRCGMQFADPTLRAKLGLRDRPAFDPDLRAGRLYDADPALTKILYRKVPSATDRTKHIVAAPAGAPPAAKDPAPGAPAAPKSNVIGPGRSAWDIARDQYDAETTTYRFPGGETKKGSEISARQWRSMPAGTVVVVGEEGDAPSGNGNRGLLEIGADGTAQDLAGDEIAASSTFYFPPGEDWSSGSSLPLSRICALPSGTRMLVGYKSGGPVSAKRPVYSICGGAWNSRETFYWDPDKRTMVQGDGIDEKNIPKGAMVFWRR